MKTSSQPLLYRFLIACVLLGTTSVLSQAQILVGYNFAGNTGGTQTFQAANTGDSSAFSTDSLTATDLTMGSGYNPSGVDSSFQNNSFGISIGGSYPSSVAASIAANQDLQFSVTSNPGTTLSLSSLSMGVFTENGQNGPGFVATMALAYSLDGGTTWSTAGIPGGDAGIPSADYTGGNQNPDPRSPALVTVDLSSISTLQNVSGTVLIDLVALNNSSYNSTYFATTSGNTGFTPSNLDDVTLAGTVVSAVPEPGSLWLLSIGLFVLVCIQQRKRASSI